MDAECVHFSWKLHRVDSSLTPKLHKLQNAYTYIQICAYLWVWGEKSLFFCQDILHSTIAYKYLLFFPLCVMLYVKINMHHIIHCSCFLLHQSCGNNSNAANKCQEGLPLLWWAGFKSCFLCNSASPSRNCGSVKLHELRWVSVFIIWRTFWEEGAWQHCFPCFCMLEVTGYICLLNLIEWITISFIDDLLLWIQMQMWLSLLLFLFPCRTCERHCERGKFNSDQLRTLWDHVTLLVGFCCLWFCVHWDNSRGRCLGKYFLRHNVWNTQTCYWWLSILKKDKISMLVTFVVGLLFWYLLRKCI